MASLKFEEAHVTKKVFPAYNMSVKKKKQQQNFQVNLSPIKYCSTVDFF